VIAGFIGHEHLNNNSRAIMDRLNANSLLGVVGNVPSGDTINKFLNNGFGQKKNPDIPYIGAPERGWDVHHPNPPSGLVGAELGSKQADAQNKDALSNSTGTPPVTSTVPWEAVYYAESSTIIGMHYTSSHINI
jgi:hypothetical protein